MKSNTFELPVRVCSILLVLAGLAGLAVAAKANDADNSGFGNHNLRGAYEFHADGVIEDGNGYIRGTWEVGRFDSDGEGNWTNGVEYSSLLSSSDETVINQFFTFHGTYEINPDGTGTAHVTVVVNPDLTIEKDLWFVIHSVGMDGIANGFAGGHADADLGDGVHGNSRTHVGWRMDLSRHRRPHGRP
ncbi:MAG: hypothetical protein R3282_03805 [Rhodothermales bacterium]|nr:hypothetical protein [Rhodothermales bacterium]